MLAGYSLVQIALLIVVVAAVCALVMVALRQFGVTLPAWLIQVLWIVVAAVVVIVAILFVAKLAGLASLEPREVLWVAFSASW